MAYQRNDDFAVRVGLEGVRLAQVLAQDLVVVDLAVDGKGNAAILVEQRLGTRVCMS